MYNQFRNGCERLLRIPPPPGPPPGDERSTRIFRAAPNYYRYLLFLWGLKTAGMLMIALLVVVPLFLGAAAWSSGNGGPEPWLVALVIVGGILLVAASLVHLAIVRLDFEKRWYVVTDRSLRIREGVLVVKEITVTFANIQNLSVDQGPLQRLLGLSDLRVDTAGGAAPATHHHQTATSAHAALFRGIDNADEVKLLIQKRLALLRDSGLGDEAEAGLVSPTQAGSDVLDLLRQIHAEARGLRMVSQQG